MTVNYDVLHEKWDAIHNEYGAPTYQLRKKIILNHIFNFSSEQRGGSEKPLSILDVGCGTGDYSIFLALHGFSVTGFDFSEYAINTAKDRCAHMSENRPEFFVGNINTFVTSKKYDLIIISEVLEHIEEDSRILQKYRDFLKSDGYVVVSVPFDRSYWSVEDEQSGHVRRYDNNTIDELFRDANLHIIKKSWIGFPTIALMWRMKRKTRQLIEFITNPKRGDATSKTIKFFSAILVWIDSHFTFIQRGVGIIVVAKKQ